MTVPTRDETARPWSPPIDNRGANGVNGPGDRFHDHQGLGHEHKATDDSLIVPGYAGMPAGYDNLGGMRGEAGSYQMNSRMEDTGDAGLSDIDHNATDTLGNRPDDPHAGYEEKQLGGGAAGQNFYQL